MILKKKILLPLLVTERRPFSLLANNLLTGLLEVENAVLWFMACNAESNGFDETFVSIFRAAKLKLEAAGSSETMVNTHQTSQSQETEDRNVSLIASSKADVLSFPPRIRPNPVQQQKQKQWFSQEKVICDNL
jgi:hypothetical protein